jgi:hypothetical protein
VVLDFRARCTRSPSYSDARSVGSAIRWRAPMSPPTARCCCLYQYDALMTGPRRWPTRCGVCAGHHAARERSAAASGGRRVEPPPTMTPTSRLNRSGH